MYQSDLQNKTSKVIIKELKEMFDRIDFHVREPETGNFHIPGMGKRRTYGTKCFRKRILEL